MVLCRSLRTATVLLVGFLALLALSTSSYGSSSQHQQQQQQKQQQQQQHQQQHQQQQQQQHQQQQQQHQHQQQQHQQQQESGSAENELDASPGTDETADLRMVQRPLPHGACITYNELRDVNFLHKEIRSSICKGVSAYSIVRSAFPMCELSDQLPRLLLDPVLSGSVRSHIINPGTQRELPCFVYKNADLISDSVRQQHIFEGNNVAPLIRLVQALKSHIPVTFVDIGANIGVYTLSALDTGVPVVALDANIRNLMRIQMSAEAAGFSHHLRLIWNFVTTQVSLMYLNFPHTCNIGGATKFSREVTDTIPVMSTTANSIASLIDPQTAVVMKVDIEGGEAEFFKSASALFSRVKVVAVHMEWLRDHMSVEERQFMANFFLSRRYSPRSLHDFGTQIMVQDANFSGDDVFWIREDFLAHPVFSARRI